MKRLTLQEVGQELIKFGEELVGEILEDFSSTGHRRPWEGFKVKGEQLALILDSLGMHKKADRLRSCASSLSFSYDPNTKKKTLVSANFCRIRLCPMCQWRRSLKVFGQVSKILRYLESQKHYGYILLTLTQKNVAGEELGAEIDRLNQAWKRFALLDPFKRAVKGYYKAMEIKHNVDYKSKSFNTYHPHFHCLIAVSPSYFTSRDYISHEQWQEMWKAAARLDYLPEVNVKRVKEDGKRTLLSAVAETAKYAVKSDDYIMPEDWDFSTTTVELLERVLHNRRFVAFGGIMKDAKKALSLDDPEDGNLISVGEDDVEIIADNPVYTYYWNSGYSQYIR